MKPADREIRILLQQCLQLVRHSLGARQLVWYVDPQNSADVQCCLVAVMCAMKFQTDCIHFIAPHNYYGPLGLSLSDNFVVL